ncbi:multifunctional acyl-CoA thioesterase I/protease I/lysophospholipase L1, partial [Pantoea agglomerans]|nr:multifunctional acyl-CoA thioesterase I/protease I/lysophospholipase L1 [Pantoea agglomerans]
MMNFNNVFRWHYPFLLLILLLVSRLAAADTLMVL